MVFASHSIALVQLRARTHWEFLILPDAPHLFYMPLPEYLGFIPFRVEHDGCISVGLASAPESLAGSAVVWIAIAGLYWLTALDVRWGIWVDG
jgi:hypothetical protein